MLEVGIVVTRNILYLINTSINGLIIRYEKSKPTGLQTCLDGTIIDTCWIRIVVFTLFCLIMNLNYFYEEPINYLFALLIILLLQVFIKFMFAAYQITLITKTVLIFVPDLIQDLRDKQIRRITRGVTIGYGFALLYLDFSGTARKSIFLEHLTGNSGLTNISPIGVGSFFGLGTFLATLVAFFIYKPVSMAEKRSAMLKLIILVLLHCILAFLVWLIDNFRPVNARLILNLLLGFCDLMQGVILPFLFINSLPNMKAFMKAKMEGILPSSYIDIMA